MKSLKFPFDRSNIRKFRVTMPTVIVKWQKDLYRDVEINVNYMTSLEYHPKGKNSDQRMTLIGQKLGCKRLMMMGTTDEIVNAPERVQFFMEDLPEEEQVVAVGHSAGLFNLGNTYYMNSTVQCLHSVPELKSALIEYFQSGRSNDLDQSSHLLTVATRNLFTELDKNVKPVAPMQFSMVLKKKYPQFGQLHNGSFMQQDVEECWSQILYTLSQALRRLSSRVHCT